MQPYLWLASWYPDARDPFDGDFVQRHAKALATQAPVYVICVKPRRSNGDRNGMRVEGNLSEDIRFYERSTLPLIGGMVTLWRYLRLSLLAVNEWERSHGRPQFIHVHVSMKAGLAALWLRWSRGVPYVITEHYNIYHRQRADSFFKRSAWYRFAVRKIFEHANGLLTVSHYIALQLQGLFPGLKSEWVPNSVDTSLFFPSEANNSIFRFVHASTMQPVKNVQGILEAIARLGETRRDFHLDLMGPVPASVRKIIDDKALADLVTLHGEVSYETVARLTRQADALVMFSRWENMPCNVLEALCCGLPVIAPRVGGIPEVVHPSNGVLVESEDTNGLVEAMLKVMRGPGGFERRIIAGDASAAFGYVAIGEKIASAYRIFFSASG